MPSFRLSPLSSLLGMVRPHLHVTSLWAVPSSAVAAILRLSPGISAEAEREKFEFWRSGPPGSQSASFEDRCRSRRSRDGASWLTFLVTPH